MAAWGDELRTVVQEAAEEAKDIMLTYGWVPPVVLVIDEAMKVEDVIPIGFDQPKAIPPACGESLRQIVAARGPRAVIVVDVRDETLAAGGNEWRHIITLSGVSPFARHTLRLVYRREEGAMSFESEIELRGDDACGISPPDLWPHVN